jgi:hypothetical protein
MSMHRKNRFIALWKAELKAAEEAVDRLTELSHRAIARRYALLAAAANNYGVRQSPA